MTKLHILISICSFICNVMFSQTLTNAEKQKAEEDAKETAKEISTEFSIPAIPALSLISSDPSDISRPSNVKRLTSTLYNAIDENGRVKQGLAVEVKPADFFSINISPEEYRKNSFKYILYNTQISLGTIATSGDSTSTDLGWGLKFTIFDDSDPMKHKSFIKKFEKAISKCAPNSPADSLPSKDCLLNAKKEVLVSFTKEKWNAKWMSIAYAGGTRLNGSEISEGKSIGHQVLLTGGFPIVTWGQFSYLAKWSEEYNEETAQMMKEAEFGGKFLVGSESYNLFAEASFNPLLNKDDFQNNIMVKTDNSFSWTVGIEFKISNGVWTIAGIGEDVDRIVGSNGIQLLSGLRMGISDKSRLKK